MDIILNFFGVIYAWVRLGNPGALMGGGGGLVVGAVAGGAFFGPVGAFFGALGGLLAGNLLGSGAYSWYQEQEVRNRQDRRARQISRVYASKCWASCASSSFVSRASQS